MKNPYEIIEYPLSTEKGVREMEASNCLIFIVRKTSTKPQIRWAIEKAFNVKVVGVRTMTTKAGKKKAYIKLSPDTPAVEITTQLGMV